jgi:hypothetical protein
MANYCSVFSLLHGSETWLPEGQFNGPASRAIASRYLDARFSIEKQALVDDRKDGQFV